VRQLEGLKSAAQLAFAPGALDLRMMTSGCLALGPRLLCWYGRRHV